MKTIFGIKGFALSEYAISANAILGIRDSGKTYTATEAGEELFEASIPWIALDPIGVWHSVRIPGKGRGYPVVVAGGRHADLPLTVKNAGAIVRAAMEAGVSLVIDLFSMELSKADWRRIVRETVEILLHENADYGLRHIFIEEAAEFVPQRPQDMLVFSAVEKLVRMGGNSKLGCTLINQRSADLNKSVLELCANVFVHRQKGKNTILDLKKWFTLLDLSAAEQDKIAKSLPDLKSGQCWAMLNDLPKPVFLKVPEKNSLHPDRRAATVPELAKRKPVPADAFVEVMKGKLAEKAKPAAKAPVIDSQASKTVEKINTPDQKAQARAMAAAREDGAQAVRDLIPAALNAQHACSFQRGYQACLKDVTAAVVGISKLPSPPAREMLSGIQKMIGTKIGPLPPPSAHVGSPDRPPAPRQAAPVNGNLKPSLQRAIDAIAWWRKIGKAPVERDRAAVVAGFSPRASTFGVYIAELVQMGLVQVTPGFISLTPEGGRLANIPDASTAEDLKAAAANLLKPQERRVFDVVYDAYPEPIRRDAVAEAVGLSPTASTAGVYIAGVAAYGIIEAAGPGQVRAADWLFPEGT